MALEHDNTWEDTGNQMVGEDLQPYKEVRHVVTQYEVERDENGRETSRRLVQVVHRQTHWEPVGENPQWREPACYDPMHWQHQLGGG